MGISANERQMAPASYWIYYIGSEQLVLSAEPLTASSDNNAIQKAKMMAGSRVVELWLRDRFVARIETANKRALRAIG